MTFYFFVVIVCRKEAWDYNERNKEREQEELKRIEGIR